MSEKKDDAAVEVKKKKEEESVPIDQPLKQATIDGAVHTLFTNDNVGAAVRGTYVIIEYGGGISKQVCIVQRVRNRDEDATDSVTIEMRWEFSSGECAVVKEYTEAAFTTTINGLHSGLYPVTKITLAQSKRVSSPTDQVLYHDVTAHYTAPGELTDESAAQRDMQRRAREASEMRRREGEEIASFAAAAKARDDMAKQQQQQQQMEEQKKRHAGLSERHHQCMALSMARQHCIESAIEQYNARTTTVSSSSSLSDHAAITSSPALPLLQALLVPSSQLGAEIPPPQKEKRRADIMAEVGAYESSIAAAAATSSNNNNSNSKSGGAMLGHSKKLHLNPNQSYKNRFVLIGMIGTGTFGEVHAAVDALTNGPVALKIIKVPERRDLGGLNAVLVREAVMTRLVAQPLLTPVRDVLLLGDGHCVIVMPLVPYDVRDLVARRFFVQDPAAAIIGGQPRGAVGGARDPKISLVRSVFGQLLEALDDMHRVRGAEHRDVKLSNVMLRSDGVLQLGDMGWARMVPPIAPSTAYGSGLPDEGDDGGDDDDDAAAAARKKRAAAAGVTDEDLVKYTLEELEAMEAAQLDEEHQERSRKKRHHHHYPDGSERAERMHTGPPAGQHYRPLELLLDPRFEYDGQKLDIYGAGCVLWELLTGQALFAAESDGDVAHKIMTIMGAPEQSTWATWKRQGLRTYGLSPGASFQPHASKLKQSLRKLGVVDEGEKLGLVRLLEDMLAYAHWQRPSAKDILDSRPFFAGYQRVLPALRDVELCGSKQQLPQHVQELAAALPQGWHHEYETRRKHEQARQRRTQQMMQQQQNQNRR